MESKLINIGFNSIFISVMQIRRQHDEQCNDASDGYENTKNT